MKLCRVSRFADDPPIPDPDTSEDRVALLPLDDATTELSFFVFFEDRTRARVRKFHVLPGGELQCFSDQVATPSELENVEERFREIDAASAKTKLANQVLEERLE